MTPSRATRALDALASLLLLVLALGFVAIVRAMPPSDPAASGVGWMVPVLTAALVVAGSTAALGMLVRGLRSRSISTLLRAGASASLAGGGAAALLASSPLTLPVLAASAFVTAAALADSSAPLGSRGAGWLAAVAVAVAETVAVVSVIRGAGAAFTGVESGLLVGAVTLATVATVLASGHRAATAALVVVGAASLLVARDGSLEAVIGVAALTAAQVIAARGGVTPVEVHPTPDLGLPALAQRLTAAVLRFDGRLRLIDWNAAAGSLLGLDPSSAGARIEDLLAVTIAELPTPDGPVVTRRAVGGLEVAMHREGDGVIAMVRDSVATPEAEQLGRELRATIEELLAARRTVELQRAELERASRTDPLTAVASRAAIVERLRVEVAQARRYRHPVTVVVVDVDDFAVINRIHGLRGGDAVLREVALRMRLRVRAADALGRAGSDGFLVVLPHTDQAGASMFADAVRHRLALRPIAVEDELLSVTVSVGVASMQPGEDLDADGLMARADEALDAARAAGGDRVVVDRGIAPPRLETRQRQADRGRPGELLGDG